MVGPSYKEDERIISVEGERKEENKRTKEQTESTGRPGDL